MLYFPVPTPVSYTHLDVYKRQTKHCVPSNLIAARVISVGWAGKFTEGKFQLENFVSETGNKSQKDKEREKRVRGEIVCEAYGREEVIKLKCKHAKYCMFIVTNIEEVSKLYTA